ncbi:MFS transporter [Actinokineospora sp.]|uniref:MFS transporter n=1 Tax=Actinokineospora sp. TaxID=1872133 RepID=UPI003D6A72E0
MASEVDTEVEEKPGVWETVRTLPRPVIVLLTGVALNRAGQFVQIFLMLYLTSIGVAPLKAGVVLTAYGIGSIVGVFAGGSFTDKIGPRRTIIISMVVSSVLTASLAVIDAYPALLPVCALAGLFSQLYRPAASTMLADYTPASRLVIASAAYRLGINIGASVGPLVGAFLMTQSFTAVFLTNAATSLGFAIVAMALLPEPKAGRTAEKATGRYVDLFADKRFVLVVLAQFITSFAEVQYLAVLPLEVSARGLPEQLYGVLLALNGLLVITLELPLMRYVQRMSMRSAIAWGSGLIGVGTALFGLPVGMWILFAGTLVWTLGEIVSAPSVVAYPALAAPQGLRGRYIAAITAAMASGYALGPTVGTALYQFYGSAVWLMCAVLGLAAAAGMTVGVLGPQALAVRSQEYETAEG